MINGVLREAYVGRRVLVTGHTGFKGAWLAIWLERLGAKVIGLSLAPPTRPNLYTVARVASRVEDRRCDLRNATAVRKAVAAIRPEVVFHLAAQPLVRGSYARPVETFATNVMGTAHLLDAIREAGRPCSVVVVSSDKCYENRGLSSGYTEEDPVGGDDPYSASKGCVELLAASWRKSFFGDGCSIRLATARAGNVIGGGDWAKDRIVPDCMAALREERPIVVRNPRSVRPWQHVLEPLAGYLVLGSRLSQANGAACCSAWNFGPSGRNTRTVKELVEEVIKCWGGGSWSASPSARGALPEAEVLTLRSTKARRDLGWQPTWGFKAAVRETVNWYKEWNRGSRQMDDFCVAQIESYGGSFGR